MFATGAGQRNSKEREELDDFDEELKSLVKRKEIPQVDEDAEQKARELKDYQKSQALQEAERRGANPTSLNPFPGLSFLPGVNPGSLAVGSTPQSEAKPRSGGVDGNEKREPLLVSPEILEKLREAGLAEPLTGLEDPRLSRNTERLSQDFVLSVGDKERVYVWSSGSDYQLATVGLRETRIESGVGDTVETLRQLGTQQEKIVRTRTESSEPFQIQDPNHET